MATSNPINTNTKTKADLFFDSDYRHAFPPDRRINQQHATQMGTPIQGKPLFPNLDSRSDFPDLVPKDQNDSIKVRSFISKTWSEVIKENRSHQSSIQLKYYEPTVLDNLRIAVIDEYLVNKGRERWTNSIDFYVFGSKPYFQFLREYVDRNWKLNGKYQLFSIVIHPTAV